MYLIEWMYDRKNGAQHSVIAYDMLMSGGFVCYSLVEDGVWYEISPHKCAWFRIKPAPKPYMPPVGQDEGSK